MNYNRRTFIKTTATGSAAVVLSPQLGFSAAKSPSVKVLNPRNRAPVSLIIDDSTTLVNLAHFGIPQFAEVFPDNYKQDWRKLPREIPDSFVREFAEWSEDNGIKGKYSIVPYPA
ncbi:MAG: twin-arginine translocation signal domain-containing protein [Draconibacterium sp.]|nr:twin-arginine translocation signal domain-containing protein [Draconibacterium sp.]